MKIELNSNGISASIDGNNSDGAKILKDSPQHVKSAIHRYIGLILGISAFFSSLFLFVFEVILKFSADLLVPLLENSITYYLILSIIICIIIELISILCGVSSIVVFAKEKSTGNLIGFIISIVSFVISITFTVTNILLYYKLFCNIIP